MAYDVRALVKELQARNVTPHIATIGNIRVCGKPRATAIDRRATRHLGYVISQRLRKRIEEGLWLGQDHREPRQDPSPRARPRRLVLHLHRHSLQPRQTAKAAGSRMSLSDDRQNPPIDVRKAPKQPFQRVPGPCSAP